jgi:AhpD family alkylhydroperoxidase
VISGRRRFRISGIPAPDDEVSDVALHTRHLREIQRDLTTAFGQLAATSTQENGLSKETRELVSPGTTVSCRCDHCLDFHVQALVKLGHHASTGLEDVLGTAVYMST